jgi:hypothetical protein
MMRKRRHPECGLLLLAAMGFLSACYSELPTYDIRWPGSPDSGQTNTQPGTDDDVTAGPDDLAAAAGPDLRTGEVAFPDQVSGEDVGPPDPCAPVTCPDNAHCLGGQCFCNEGYLETEEGLCVLPPPSCIAEGCSDTAWCDPVEQVCVCKPGFDTVGGECVSPPLVPPAERTLEEVCARYHQEIVQTAAEQVSGGDAGQCDPGVSTREALNDGLRRLNLYRWLAGLEPAWDVEATNVGEQECALMQSLHNGLSHSPSPDWQCYTSAGAGASGSSNLALGIYSIADSVDLYMVDNGVASLGHRRWCLNPALGHTGFGFFGKASCMYAFGTGNNHYPQFVAWPSPGYFPEPLEEGVWSFASNKCSWNADTTGEALRVDTGEVFALDLEDAGGNYGGMGTLRMVPIKPEGTWGPAPKLEGQVQITLFGLKCSGEPTDLTYTVKLVDCPAPR